MTADIRPVTTGTNLLPRTIEHVDRYLSEGYGLFPIAARMHVPRNMRILGIYELPGTRVVQVTTSVCFCAARSETRWSAVRW